MISSDSIARFCAAALVGWAPPALAETANPADDLARLNAQMEIVGLAQNLGGILGSEAFCGLTLDQDGIANWVRKNVPPASMDFQTQLQMMTMGQQAFNSSMTPSSKTAHCAAVEQAARENGLTSPP